MTVNLYHFKRTYGHINAIIGLFLHVHKDTCMCLKCHVCGIHIRDILSTYLYEHVKIIKLLHLF